MGTGTLECRQIDTELGIFARTGHVNGDEGSSSIFFKEAVGGLKQQALPTADHLRDGCIHTGCAGEVERAILDAVGTFELNVRAGHGVVEVGQRGNGVSNGEVRAHGGVDGRGLRTLGVAGTPLSAQAEFVHFGLDFVAGELSLLEIEKAIEGNATDDLIVAGRDVEMRLQADSAGE